MKKAVIMLVLMLALYCLSACSEKTSGETVSSTDGLITDTPSDEEFGGEDDFEDDGVFGEQAEITLYANGGVIWMGEENPYDVDLSASAMDVGVTFAEAIGEPIHSVEKEGAEFAGWKIYAVKEGEWITEAVEVGDGQEMIACGDYGYYLMSDYEIVSEVATTVELLAMESDGRNYYVVAVWK